MPKGDPDKKRYTISHELRPDTLKRVRSLRKQFGVLPSEIGRELWEAFFRLMDERGELPQKPFGIVPAKKK